MPPSTPRHYSDEHKAEAIDFCLKENSPALEQPNGLACIQASLPVGCGNIALIKEKHYRLIVAC
jgi:hypothetical protein